ncbi:Uncharacterised protein [Aeromonas salmonicida]|uniref:hypothetical protein n=1 Tax=Aeromonas salmonicida TaxID=645 RepID=UPI00102514C2|nr:hypothetical protein [Aeromonas salmonicida]VFB09609.1 Uncharacterised protein [Aeromonas salmonicida]
MKKKYNKVSIVVLPFILLSLPSISADICSMDSEYKYSMSDFSPNNMIAELDSIENGNVADFLASIPSFEEDINKLKLGALDFFNLELSALQLKDGLENGNTKEIVGSSVMLASTFVPAIVDTTIEALALEFDSNPVTMAIGASIMVGMNIYNGVEEDRSIEQQKKDLSDTDKIYKDRAEQLKNALSSYRRIIAGDDEALVKMDEENVSEIIIGALKKNVNTTIINLSKDALNKRTLEKGKTSLLHNEIPNLVGKSISDSLSSISSFLENEYAVEGRYIPMEKIVHNLNRANWQYVGMWANIPPADMEQALKGGVNTVLISPFKHFLSNYVWLKDTYISVLNKILDELYVNNDMLYNTLSSAIKYQLTNPDFQEDIRNHYNITISRNYAWVKFGSELLESLDLSEEQSADVSMWTARVLTPFIAPLVENNMANYMLNELNVQSKVATIVNKLINLNVDIRNKDAFYAIIKANEQSENLPSSLLHAIDTAYENTRIDVKTLLISRDEIKPFDLSVDTVNKILVKLQLDIDSGKFNKAVQDALHNYAMDILFAPGYQSNPTGFTKKLYAIAGKISAMQAAYNGHVNVAIRKANDDLHKATDQEEVVGILNDLGSYLINNYYSFYDGNIPLILPNTDQNVEFISFGALPFALNDLKYILEIISAEINVRQKTIDDTKLLIPFAAADTAKN